MHALSQLHLDLSKLLPHAVPLGLPLKLEGTMTRSPADKGEAQKIEGLRFPKPALSTLRRRMTTKLQQSCLVRMKHKQELLKPQAHRLHEASRVGSVLKAHNNIIREPQNDDVTFGFSPSPALGPEIEDVV